MLQIQRFLEAMSMGRQKENFASRNAGGGMILQELGVPSNLLSFLLALLSKNGLSYVM